MLRREWSTWYSTEVHIASQVKIPGESFWHNCPAVRQRNTACLRRHLSICKPWIEIWASCFGSFLLENPLGIHSFVVVALCRDIGEKFAKKLLITILFRSDVYGLTDLHKFSSYHSSGGGQDLAVVFPGEFAFQHLTLHLPGSLFEKHTFKMSSGELYFSLQVTIYAWKEIKHHLSVGSG